MTDELPTTVATETPQDSSMEREPAAGRLMLSGWMAAQLSIAVFLIPAASEIVELYRGLAFREPQYRMWLHFSDFTADQANILWIAQVGLVLNVIGSAARGLVIRWATLLAGMVFLLVQPGGVDYTGSLYFSFAAVAGVWLIWDPSPLGWRMILGTVVGFVLVAAHYSVFARTASAYQNSLLLLHYALVIGGLLLFRGLGWRLSLPNANDPPENSAANTSAKFSFGHLFLCVTCCGLGLMLLRYINFASAEFLSGRDFAGIGNPELISGLFTSGFVAPVLCLVAAWAVFSERVARYWLGLLFGAGMLLVGLELFRPEPLLVTGQYTTQGWRALIEPYASAIFVANNCLMVVAAPTALLLVYRAAGFRWRRVARSAAGH